MFKQTMETMTSPTCQTFHFVLNIPNLEIVQQIGRFNMSMKVWNVDPAVHSLSKTNTDCAESTF